jgi:hypothetical protein
MEARCVGDVTCGVTVCAWECAFPPLLYHVQKVKSKYNLPTGDPKTRVDVIKKGFPGILLRVPCTISAPPHHIPINDVVVCERGV